MPVSTVFENLQDVSIDELVEEFGVTRGSIRLAALMLVLFDNGTPRTLALSDQSPYRD